MVLLNFEITFKININKNIRNYSSERIISKNNYNKYNHKEISYLLFLDEILQNIKNDLKN